MIYQISSGQGPAECELGVAKFLAYLQNIIKSPYWKRHRDTTKIPIAPCESRQMLIYRSLSVRCSGSVQVLTALVTSARTGSWI